MHGNMSHLRQNASNMASCSKPASISQQPQSSMATATGQVKTALQNATNLSQNLPSVKGRAYTCGLQNHDVSHIISLIDSFVIGKFAKSIQTNIKASPHHSLMALFLRSLAWHRSLLGHPAGLPWLSVQQQRTPEVTSAGHWTCYLRAISLHHFRATWHRWPRLGEKMWVNVFATFYRRFSEPFAFQRLKLSSKIVVGRSKPRVWELRVHCLLQRLLSYLLLQCHSQSAWILSSFSRYGELGGPDAEKPIQPTLLSPWLSLQEPHGTQAFPASPTRTCAEALVSCGMLPALIQQHKWKEDVGADAPSWPKNPCLKHFLEHHASLTCSSAPQPKVFSIPPKTSPVLVWMTWPVASHARQSCWQQVPEESVVGLEKGWVNSAHKKCHCLEKHHDS